MAGTPVREALDSARRSRSRRPGVDTPRLDAEVLLAHALGIDRLALLVDGERDGAGPGRARLPGRRAPARGRPRAGGLHHRASRAFATSTCTSTGACSSRARRPRHLVEAALGLPQSRARGRRRHGQRRGGARAQGRAPGPRGDGDRRQRGRAGRGARQRRAARARRRASCTPTCSTASGELDAVVSNPPYVEDGRASWRPRSPATSRRRRLYAGLDGLAVVRRLVAQAGERGGRLPRRRGRRRPGAGRRGARCAPPASRAPSAAPTSPGSSGWWPRGAEAPPTPQTFERCIAVGGIAVFPADTVYGLACEPDSKEAVQRLYMLKRRRPDKPAAVMFFALDLALAALPELGPRTAGGAARAAARRR